MLATHRGKKDAWRGLLEKKATDVNVKNKRQETALICAVKRGDAQDLALLLERGDLDLDCEDDEGKTALTWATEACNGADGDIDRRNSYCKIVRTSAKRLILEAHTKMEMLAEYAKCGEMTDGKELE